MKKPRICFINPTVILKRPIAQIIDKLSKEGYKTSILMPKKAFVKYKQNLHYERLINKSKRYYYSTIKLTNAEQPIPVSLTYFTNFFKAMKNNDIIHMWVPYYLTHFVMLFMKKIFFPRKKLILTMDTIPSISFSMGSRWNWTFKVYNTLGRGIIYGTPDIISLYGKSLEKYAIKAGVKKNKIKIIPTGIDLDNKKISSKENSHLKKKLGIKQGTKIVLFIGLLIKRKGVDKILEIANSMKKQNTVFLLVGDGPKEKEYKKLRDDLDLNKSVKFLGRRKDVYELYNIADVFLLPAEGEGLPGVVMEAMSQGVPCVTSNIPCIPDLIDNNINGYLCNPNDIKSFSKRINELFKNKNKRKKFSKSCVQKMKAFDWKKIIKYYEQIYSSLIK